jgi:hypothetical protein
LFKRSSFDSLAWDDFLPYKPEREEESEGESSYDTIENSTDLDSKETTPFFIGMRWQFFHSQSCSFFADI